MEIISERTESTLLCVDQLQICSDEIHMLDSTESCTFVLLGCVECFRVKICSWDGGRCCEELDIVSRWFSTMSMNTYSILSINPSIQLLAFNHLCQLLINRRSRRSKLLIESIQCNTRERNEVLNDTLATNKIV
jgi:hypothetical protein